MAVLVHCDQCNKTSEPGEYVEKFWFVIQTPYITSPMFDARRTNYNLCSLDCIKKFVTDK